MLKIISFEFLNLPTTSQITRQPRRYSTLLYEIKEAVRTLVAFLVAGFVAKCVAEWREQLLRLTNPKP